MGGASVVHKISAGWANNAACVLVARAVRLAALLRLRMGAG